MDQYLANWLEFGQWMREEQNRNPSPTTQRLRKIRAELETARRKNPNLDVLTKIAELSAKYRAKMAQRNSGRIGLNLAGYYP